MNNESRASVTFQVRIFTKRPAGNRYTLRSGQGAVVLEEPQEDP